MRSRRFLSAFCLVVFAATALLAQSNVPIVATDVHHDVSPPLILIPPQREAGPPFEVPLLRIHPNAPVSPDGALQTTVISNVSTSGGLSFDGVGNGFSGPQGTFSVRSAPPDTNGAVGATQYVQWVNTSFAVFDKSNGAVLYGPAAGNTLWSGFGGVCQSTNSGDPVVKYDSANQRWIMSQLGFSSASSGPWYQCIAVSQTSDATGSWNRYAFQYSALNDYPKMAVWPDAYYESFNMFNNGASFAGSQACAYNGAAMRAGTTATQICFQTSSAYGGLLPADLDGSTQPPAGSAAYYLAFGTNQLQLWRFHVDFTTPSNSTFTGPTLISVASFSEACGGGTCIPQQGVSQQLDSLADRLMYRLSFRQFADHNALLANHSVTAGTSVGVRWYELRAVDTGTPQVYQQSTFAPDSNYRWMGSIAMDKAGDMALGYSVSSSGLFPSIRYTGRVPTDAVNTMEAEATIQAGGGSQTYPGGLSRWGDYSSMAIDPVDDCTFWYTTEYLRATGGFNWSTHIYSFSFPGCATPTVPAAPTNLAASGGTGQINLSWNASSGATSYNVLRSSTSGSGYAQIGTSNTTSYPDSTAANGSTYYYVVEAVNSAGTSGNSTQASATALAAPTGLGATAGNGSVSLSWTGSTGATGYNVYRSTTNGGPYSKIGSSATTSYSDTTVTNGTTYYYVVTATATNSESSQSGQASATPTGPPPPSGVFASLTTGSSTLTLKRGSSGSDVITVNTENSYSGSVTLSVSGLPSRTSSSFSVNPVTVSSCGASTPTACGSSTLQIKVNRSANPGNYPLTVTGNDGTTTQTVNVTLTIQ